MSLPNISKTKKFIGSTAMFTLKQRVLASKLKKICHASTIINSHSDPFYFCCRGVVKNACRGWRQAFRSRSGTRTCAYGVVLRRQSH